MPAKRQNLLFSATFPDDIKRLCESLLHNPERVQIARKNAVAESVSHVMHPVSRERKRDLLIHLIKVRNMHQVLVFTATRLGCNRLAYQLNKDGVHAAAIHGDKSQSERIEALDAFKAGKVAILVATDVAARGLDIAELPSVVNFDLPNTPEDYVHRIGRTGRAGNTGEAISLVCPEEQEKLTEIEKMIKTTIRSEVITGYEPGARDAAPSSEPPRRNREQGDQRGPREPRDSHQRGRGARPERGEPVKSGERERTTPSQSPAPRARAPKAPSDPIFTKPYEPTEQREGVLSASPTSPPRPQRQVAALLGGMARKRD